MRIALTGIALAALAALGSPAHADGDVGVIVTGEGSVQPQLEAHIEDWLSRHGHRLVPSPLPPEAISALIDCFVAEDQTCARNVVEKRAKSSSMVYARVDSRNATSGAREVTLTAYWFDKGHDAVAERKICQRCNEQALQTTTDEIMRKLLGSGDGHVKFRSNPAGARITIDGHDIGVTPLDWDLPAGKHAIVMDRRGLASASSEIVVVGDRTEVLALELAPLPAVERVDEASRIVPIAMLAAGGALIATGAVLIAIDQDPGRSEPAVIRNTAPAGIGLAIGGAAISSFGAYLLWFHAPRATQTPVATFTSDTAYVGWAGRF
jgi:hypothetical protein